MNRRDFVAMCAASLQGAKGWAQTADYPRRPITVVYPYPPGTIGDAETRELGEFVQRTMGQPLVIDYRPGASGTLATQNVMRAPADGYTLLFGSTTTMITGPLVVMKQPYNARTDFEPVAGMGQVAGVLVVPAKSKHRTLQDLVADMKANPGKLNYGSVGPGSGSHLNAELFLRTAGATATHVPYKGPPQAQLALINGEIDFLFEVVQSSRPQIEAGRLRSLGVGDKKRLPQLPDVPTLTEAGVPLTMSLWLGFFAPKGTPRAIVDKLSRGINDYMNQPEVKAKFASRGFEAISSTTEEFEKTLAADAALWTPLIKSLNIQPQ